MIALGKEVNIVTSHGSLFSERTTVVDLARFGRIKMPIQGVFELEDIASANELLASRTHVGKIVVRV